MSKQELGPNQTKWIEALESGKYEQCQEWLFDGKGYCCLGVAVKIIDPQATIEVVDFGEDDVESLLKPKFSGILSDQMVKKLGLNDVCGTPSDTLYAPLTTLNDDEGKSFKEIASILRNHPDVYFDEVK